MNGFADFAALGCPKCKRNKRYRRVLWLMGQAGLPKQNRKPKEKRPA